MSLRKSYLIVILGVLSAIGCATSVPDPATHSDETSISDGTKKTIDPKSKTAKVRLEKYPAQEQ